MWWVESEEDLRAMVGRFVEVFMRRGLKFNADKSRVMVLNGEERLECEVHVDGIRLEQGFQIWGICTLSGNLRGYIRSERITTTVQYMM